MQVKDVYEWRSRLARLQPQFLAHQLQLVVLELLERLLPRRVADDTRRVDHARAEEPIVKVVAAVVVVADLVLVLVLILVLVRPLSLVLVLVLFLVLLLA